MKAAGWIWGKADARWRVEEDPGGVVLARDESGEEGGVLESGECERSLRLERQGSGGGTEGERRLDFVVKLGSSMSNLKIRTR